MKKQQLDHILRAAGNITGQKQFVIVGSQALHGKYPDLADTIVMSAEVDLFAPRQPDSTELLNEIGVDSPFHATYGFYADPVDEATAVLPKGWKGRLVNLPAGDTGGVRGLCLEPHDLAISKYAVRRDKDKTFTQQLARRGLVDRETLLALVDQTPVSAEIKQRIRGYIEGDFASSGEE
jgi:hypothetical protein